MLPLSGVPPGAACPSTLHSVCHCVCLLFIVTTVYHPLIGKRHLMVLINFDSLLRSEVCVNMDSRRRGVESSTVTVSRKTQTCSCQSSSNLVQTKTEVSYPLLLHMSNCMRKTGLQLRIFLGQASMVGLIQNYTNFSADYVHLPFSKPNRIFSPLVPQCHITDRQPTVLSPQFHFICLIFLRTSSHSNCS